MGTLTFNDVTKLFGDAAAVQRVTMEAADGEFVVLVGPSGCGKTTLLRMAAGLERPTSGEILMDGERLNERPPRERNVAMVFQDYALYPHMTVFQNMSFPLEARRMPKAEIRSRVRKVAATIGLGELLDRRPRELSGGQRQRVAMGRAIVREPEAFLFDEPLSNLDAKLRVQMRAEIRQLCKRLGTTSLYVTHDQVEAMTMADRIVVLNAGRVQQIGAPEEVYQRPANRFVAGFIGSPAMNFISGEVARSGEDWALVSGDGQLALPAQLANRAGTGYVCLGIRPEAFEVGRIEGTHLQVRGRATLSELLGRDLLLTVETEVGAIKALVPPEVGPVEHIDLSVPLKNIHVFRE